MPERVRPSLPLAVLHTFLFLLASADPGQAVTLLRQGLVELQRGQLTEARRDLESASAIDATNPYIWTSLAQTYLRLKDKPMALQAAQTAGKLSGGNAVAAHALAVFYQEAGDADQSVSFAAKAWAADQTNEQFCFEYAEALLYRGDFTASADTLEAGLRNRPTSAQLQLAFGVARYGQRRFDEAIDAFLKTIQIDPGIEQPYVFLGRMLDQAGPKLPEITADFKAWSERQPGNYLSSFSFAKALSAGAGDPKTIESLLRRSIGLNADYWESHYELGLLLAKRREFSDAAAELVRSINLNPKEATPHYHLARVYDRLGDPEKAKAERDIHEQLSAAEKK